MHPARRALRTPRPSFWLLLGALAAASPPLAAQQPEGSPAPAASPQAAAAAPAAPAATASGEEARDPRIEALLGQLSLREKIGQMTMLTLGALARRDAGGELRVDAAALEKAVGQYGIGAIFNTVEYGLPPEQWRELVRRLQGAALGRTGQRIPLLYALDAVHGPNYTLGATLFPHEIGLAAARDPELVRRVAAATAASLRRDGVTWTFGPVVDVGRQPLWPRLEESFGEDVFLVSELAGAAVRGYEGAQPRVATSIKHFLGHGGPRSGLDKSPAYIPETQLRELELPPFRAGIAAGASAVMLSSAEVNGEPVHANPRYLQQLLRRELGFRGVILSNWAAIQQLHSVHRVAPSLKEAVRLAIGAGVDMAMVPLDYTVPDLLLQLVQEGAISQQRIDDSVRRILTMKQALGLFEDPYPAALPDPEPAARALALEAALASVTLLKNEPGPAGRPLLPLGAASRVLLVGPTCDSLPALHGGWSYTWTGEGEAQYPASARTLLQVLRERLGAERVASLDFEFATPALDAAALRKAAAGADAVVVCLGEPASAEFTGNIDELELPPNQQELARAAARSGVPLIGVLLQGRPRIVREIEPLFAAILLGYRPGSQGAQALAQVLLGEHNPSGRLPFSYPRASGNVVLYDAKPSEERTDLGVDSYGYRPQWPFGFGLSYTDFRYGELRVAPRVWDGRTPLRIELLARNTGARAGVLVTELYTRDLYASLTPARQRLRRFARTALEPGASRELRFELTPADLSFIGADLQPVTEPGEFEVIIGEQRQRFEYRPAAPAGG